MDDDTMLNKEEAEGVLDMVKEHMLHAPGQLTEQQRHGIGRLLSEVQFTFENGQPEAKLQIIK